MVFNILPEDVEDIIMRRCHELNSIDFRRDIVEIHNPKRYGDIYDLCYRFFVSSKSISCMKIIVDLHQIIVNLRGINVVKEKRLKSLKFSCTCQDGCKCSVFSAEEHLSYFKMVNRFNKICGEKIAHL